MVDKNLDYYLKAFKTLRSDRANINRSGFAAPHKPILVLSFIQAIAKGDITDTKIFLTPALIDLFTTLWAALAPTIGYHPLIAQPFFRLKNESLRWWRLIPNPGCELWVKQGPVTSLSSLSIAVSHAEIDEELFMYLTIPESRELLRFAVMNEFFPDKIDLDLDGLESYTDKISRLILTQNADEYVMSIKVLSEQYSDSADGKEFLSQDKSIRGRAFQATIPKVYKFMCCISGLKVDATFNVSMVDACHIVPFANSFNDTIKNGIALCPNLHRAFDRGLISIDDGYRVIISSRFKESDSIYSIKRFAGQPIILPEDKKYLPDLEAFAWHRRNTFKN